MCLKRFSKCKCCEVESVFGHSLKEGVIFVGITSLVISLVMLFTAITGLLVISCMKKQYNNNPIVATNLIFGLVAACLSTYQIIITLLLLWQATKGNIFLCSLWFVSHISLLTMYFLLFSAEVVVCFVKKRFITAVVTMFIGILYEATFIYFAIIVNSYLHSLNQTRYL
ncbi:uncharacterized protein LOC125068894 isoform X2 [Vanessa atalanta]|uniref:uncharacterized protein LOC125068894 isoform X2 n=1 Tax=Vanessa atalanta TaxID=42275 RepID=UPI001FCDA842|nr:uncharacterized protein LOC125068894 isoform X2 [Vanessa atalanta]